jgi:hypothetical protein
MENHHLSKGKSTKNGPFSIAMLNYQRVISIINLGGWSSILSGMAFFGRINNHDGISIAHVPCSLTMAHAQLTEPSIYDQGISHTMSGLEYVRIWFNIIWRFPNHPF